MIAVVRFRLPAGYDAERFRLDLESLLGVLTAATGFEGGTIGRNVDDPDLWLLTTTWVNPGAYRRALSPHEVRLSPVWRVAVDEPSAYEPVEPGGALNIGAARSIG